LPYIPFENWKKFITEEKEGAILAIFGPSASGKSRQKNIFKNNGWDEIVSYVTRPPRGETDAEYEFASEEEWKEESDKGNLINKNQYAGNFYGTKISDFRNAGNSILVTDITNVDGSRGEEDLKNIAAREGKKLILIFSAPPAAKELIRRHKERLDSGEYSSQEEYETRVQKAKDEASEMSAIVKSIDAQVYTIYDDEGAEKLARDLL
tara:strand:- start:249 stop:872 length:624 start_codon:yes stop_codon:yes gene_type:complete